MGTQLAARAGLSIGDGILVGRGYDHRVVVRAQVAGVADVKRNGRSARIVEDVDPADERVVRRHEHAAMSLDGHVATQTGDSAVEFVLPSPAGASRPCREAERPGRCRSGSEAGTPRTDRPRSGGGGETLGRREGHHDRSSARSGRPARARGRTRPAGLPAPARCPAPAPRARAASPSRRGPAASSAPRSSWRWRSRLRTTACGARRR